nr:DUF4231 domain-containing protein [uncultured Methanoregula sp.]
MPPSENPTVERLEAQLRYYSQSSRKNRLWYKWLKVAEIIAAAAIPLVVVIFPTPKCSDPPVTAAFIAALLGMLIVILEGFQGLNQYQHNWITFRSTAEDLKHEKYLWLAKAGPYANTANPDTLLAERIESLISREHSKWISSREREPKNNSESEK